MRKLLFNIFQNITAEFAEVFEVLESGMNFNRVDFQIFVRQKVSQTSHRLNFSGKVFGYDSLYAKRNDCFFIFTRAFPVVLRNYVMGNVEEGLYV